MDIYELSCEAILLVADIKERITELEQSDMIDTGLVLMSPEEELATLKSVLDQIPAGETSLIRESYFQTYADDKAEDTYGREAVESSYFDSNRFESDLMDSFREITIADTVYLYEDK